MTSTAKRQQIDRWYLRCGYCLGIVAVSEQPPREVFCETCGGPIECMGRVTRERKLRVSTEFVVPCDDRCTGAKGPSCNCSCDGANHGTGALVEIVHDTAIPKIPQLDKPKRMAIAAEFRAAFSVLQQLKMDRWPDRIRNKTEYLSGDDYGQYLKYQTFLEDLSDIRGMKQHKARMERIKNVRESSYYGFGEASHG